MTSITKIHIFPFWKKCGKIQNLYLSYIWLISNLLCFYSKKRGKIQIFKFYYSLRISKLLWQANLTDSKKARQNSKSLLQSPHFRVTGACQFNFGTLSLLSGSGKDKYFSTASNKALHRFPLHPSTSSEPFKHSSGFGGLEQDHSEQRKRARN